ncbi:MAG: 50S ribosomal protein L28 [Candidatus Gastranaerophilales bacterium]|nr:50S ribosomal protein L28 [Candidatus Gastranaerophilales bacterium]
MSRQCEICGKKPLKAAKRSFSNKAHTYKQIPNLQSVKAVINGKVKKANVCTSCIRANKVQKAV